MRTTTLTALALLCACDFMHRGNDLESGDLADGGCVDEVTVLTDLDAATALGFAPAEALALAVGEHASPITWGAGIDETFGAVHVGPESGAGTLTVGITHAGGEARFIHSKPAGAQDEGAFALCSDRVEVDVEVTLSTAGGALAESFPAALRATTARIATIRHDLPIAGLAGSLAVQAEPADTEVGDLRLDLGVHASGLFGGLSATVALHLDDAVAATDLQVARWPGDAAECAYGEAPVGLADAVAGFSAEAALKRIAAAGPLQIAWNGGPAVGFTVAAAPADGPVCATYEGFEGVPVGALRFAAEVTVESADQRWSGGFPVQIQATPDEAGELAAVELHVDAPYAAELPADEFAATYGLQGVDLTGYDGAALDFRAAYLPAGDGVDVQGVATVLGVVAHTCAPDANGCEGDPHTELETAVWGTP
jgi:hypothetical protein